MMTFGARLFSDIFLPYRTRRSKLDSCLGQFASLAPHGLRCPERPLHGRLFGGDGRLVGGQVPAVPGDPAVAQVADLRHPV